MVFRKPNPVFSADYESLRQVLLKARRDARISQRTLAERIGKSHSHVCMIERGQRRIDVLEFCTIAASLGANPLQLFAEVVACLTPGGGCVVRQNPTTCPAVARSPAP